MAETESSDRDVTDELDGFELFQGERDLGEIEGIVPLDERRYYVLDARHWTFGAWRLVPVEAITEADPGERQAFTTFDIERLRAAPDFDPFRLNDGEYARTVNDYYR